MSVFLHFCSNIVFTFIKFCIINTIKNKTQRMWKYEMIKQKQEFFSRTLVWPVTFDLQVVRAGSGSDRLWGESSEGGVTDLVAGSVLSPVVRCSVRWQTQIEPRTLAWGHKHTWEQLHTRVFICGGPCHTSSFKHSSGTLFSSEISSCYLLMEKLNIPELCR